MILVHVWQLHGSFWFWKKTASLLAFFLLFLATVHMRKFFPFPLSLFLLWFVDTSKQALWIVFTIVKWFWLFETLGKDDIFKIGNTLYSPKFWRATLNSGKSFLMVRQEDATGKKVFVGFTNELDSASMNIAQISYMICWHSKGPAMGKARMVVDINTWHF